MPDPDPTPPPAPPSGDPAPTPPSGDPAPPPAPQPNPDPSPEPNGDEAKWKAMSRKHEAESKRLAAELEKVRRDQMSESEKAIEAAKAEGRNSALVEAGTKIAAAEVKAALTGIVPDPGAVVEDLNLARFVGDDGEVKAEAVEALKAKYAALKPSPGSADGGARGSAVPGQLDRAALLKMTPEQIVEAKAKGQLNDLLGVS